MRIARATRHPRPAAAARTRRRPRHRHHVHQPQPPANAPGGLCPQAVAAVWPPSESLIALKPSRSMKISAASSPRSRPQPTDVPADPPDPGDWPDRSAGSGQGAAAQFLAPALCSSALARPGLRHQTLAALHPGIEDRGAQRRHTGSARLVNSTTTTSRPRPAEAHPRSGRPRPQAPRGSHRGRYATVAAAITSRRADLRQQTRPPLQSARSRQEPSRCRLQITSPGSTASQDRQMQTPVQAGHMIACQAGQVEGQHASMPKRIDQTPVPW